MSRQGEALGVPQSRRRGGSIVVSVLAVVMLAHGIAADQPSETAWDAARVLRLETAKPGAESADLAPLAEWLGGAELVGLGEQVHGASELFRLKHRMFDVMVREAGFTVFALEANQTACERLNAYVHGAPGDPRQLLSGLENWIWDTQELLDLVAWMRETNLNAHRDLSFAGFDMKMPGPPMDAVEAFLQKVDPRAARDVHEVYGRFRGIRGFGAIPQVGGGLRAELPVERFRGHKVTLSGWIRTSGVDRFASDGAGPGISLVTDTDFAYGPCRPGTKVPGTTDWTRYAVEIDVPASSSHLIM